MDNSTTQDSAPAVSNQKIITSEKPQVTPKDFILYAGLMISLYWSAVNLGILWFEYINRLFPDQLDSWVDPFSSTIRFSMASLFVMVPIFITLSYFINKDIRRDTSKAGLWIRRWLLYISLLIAGVAVAIDLITLINVFLSGEVTVRFLLKVLTVLIIAGGGFAYYIFDIRGFWQTRARLSQSIGAGVVALVIASIVAGFIIAGTPGEQRALRFDQTRVSDLQSLQWQLVDYWQNKGDLPENLGELDDSVRGFTVPTDPETQDSYRYERESEVSFTLCATFAKSATNPNAFERYPVATGITESNWSHEAGEQCFERTIDPDVFLPKPTETVPVG